ncbi:MAG: KpsF/GutQ family sugar-phosphate isomerase [Defluviitaleaceae bacterium]|nr:KpsF/GutQ family sugar-phosphate isomerase [Defluviitaleaceae bacterium]
MNLLSECINIFDIEIAQLIKVKDALDNNIVDIVNEIHNCKGKTVICGVGKPGHIARKIAATFSSLGIASFYLHPGEALHGDLGSLNKDDVIIIISNSGNSKEILKLFPTLKLIGLKIIAITSNPESDLALYSDIVLCMPRLQEACNLDLAPTSSTTAELVIGDALAVVVSMMRGFRKEDYALRHPEGALGSRLLTRVSDVMRFGSNIPMISKGTTVKNGIIEISAKGLGATLVLDSEGVMTGIITDGDLRRALEKNIDIYAGMVDELMTTDPISTHKDMLAIEALKIMQQGKRAVSVLPVIDSMGRPEGIVSNHDIIRSGIIL